MWSLYVLGKDRAVLFRKLNYYYWLQNEYLEKFFIFHSITCIAKNSNVYKKFNVFYSYLLNISIIIS